MPRRRGWVRIRAEKVGAIGALYIKRPWPFTWELCTQHSPLGMKWAHRHRTQPQPLNFHCPAMFIKNSCTRESSIGSRTTEVAWLALSETRSQCWNNSIHHYLITVTLWRPLLIDRLLQIVQASPAGCWLFSQASTQSPCLAMHSPTYIAVDRHFEEIWVDTGVTSVLTSKPQPSGSCILCIQHGWNFHDSFCNESLRQDGDRSRVIQWLHIAFDDKLLSSQQPLKERYKAKGTCGGCTFAVGKVVMSEKMV